MSLSIAETVCQLEALAERQFGPQASAINKPIDKNRFLTQNFSGVSGVRWKNETCHGHGSRGHVDHCNFYKLSPITAFLASYSLPSS